MALAAYQGKRPKIVWAPGPTPPRTVYEVQLGDYGSTAGLLAAWTETDPEGLVTWSLDATHTLTSTAAIRGRLTGLTPTAYPYTSTLTIALGGFTPGVTYTLPRSCYSTGDTTLPPATWVALDTTVTADGAGVVVLTVFVTIGAGAPTADFWWDGLWLVAPGAADPGDLGLLFPGPLRAARSWTAPSPGADAVLYPSGAEDAWIDVEDAFLEGTVALIPAEDTAYAIGPVTGWNAANGWQRFLEWARRGNTFTFYRDADDAASGLECYLVQPTSEPAIDAALFRRFTLQLRSATGARFTGY